MRHQGVRHGVRREALSKEGVQEDFRCSLGHNQGELDDFVLTLWHASKSHGQELLAVISERPTHIDGEPPKQEADLSHARIRERGERQEAAEQSIEECGVGGQEFPRQQLQVFRSMCSEEARTSS